MKKHLNLCKENPNNIPVKEEVKPQPEAIEEPVVIPLKQKHLLEELKLILIIKFLMRSN